MTRPTLRLIDAGLVISHLCKKSDADRWLMAHPPVGLAISTVTLFEIESSVGLFHDQELERRNSARVLSVIALKLFDAEAARQAAAVRDGLERIGSTIGPYNTVLAGHALALGAVVVTESLREFKSVKGLRVEPWRESTKR